MRYSHDLSNRKCACTLGKPLLPICTYGKRMLPFSFAVNFKVSKTGHFALC
jgi:hypothetical protein